ncbi:hypothetical protein BC629DRAFT_1085286 [Irpex lacteus]|nr:hypothetical protein BC629DRAFT_1085286 [Irpex lacteus]
MGNKSTEAGILEGCLAYGRRCHDIFLSEANVYDSLRRLGSHQLSSLLPVVIACGDVRLSDGTPLCTLTQSLADPYDQWSRHTLQRRIRHRIVQKLALPLCMVRNSKELLRAVLNTLEVIVIAHHQSGILHEDISAGNIMLSQDFADILDDWDHAAREVHHYRTGTWQFMSTELLQNVTKPHRIHDDVESTFWVFYYISVHHFKIISGASNLDLFDEQRCVIEDDGEVRYTGGMAKMGTLLNQEIQKFRFESQPLTRVLHKFADILRDHYKFQLFASDFDASISAVLESKAATGLNTTMRSNTSLRSKSS